MKRLAIVTTHPIQYYAPVFKRLAFQHPNLKVFYTWGEDSIKKYDPDFKKVIEWDVPLLEGYPHEFLRNTSLRPGTSHFRGIVNPDAISILEEYNPDVFLIYGWSWHSHLKIIRHFSGKKKIWFRGDSTCLDKTVWYKEIVRKQLLRWVYQHVDLAFYVGTENKKYFERFGLKDDQLHFAPHAIDNDRFTIENRTEAKRIREQLDIPETGTMILYAGKFEPKKDPFTLLQAFEEIADNDLFLVFVGNGILEKRLKDKAQQSSKNKRIRFLNFQNQSLMPAIYQCAQAFCLPSAGPGETWGLAVNEAMAAGKPVVVSDKVGCAVDLVKERVNGAVFRNKDYKDLANKLLYVINRKSLLPMLGLESKKIIEEWSFDRQVSSILGEIKKMA